MTDPPESRPARRAPTDVAVPPAPFAEPFVAMVEALRMGPTFSRGRRDARAGHVRSLTISSSLVVAQVRGPEEPAAFRARIAVRAFGAAEWSRVEDRLAGQARYGADLLAGRMPADIEAVFAGAGLSLLPLSIGEIAMDCTCERWPMPCRHLAATVYELGRSFDTDPFGVFAWRGRARDELLGRLRRLRGASAVEAQLAAAAEPVEQIGRDAGLGGLAGFWGGGTPSRTAPSVPTGRPDALLDQLDPPELTADGEPLTEALRPAYRALPTD